MTPLWGHFLWRNRRGFRLVGFALAKRPRVRWSTAEYRESLLSPAQTSGRGNFVADTSPPMTQNSRNSETCYTIYV